MLNFKIRTEYFLQILFCLLILQILPFIANAQQPDELLVTTEAKAQIEYGNLGSRRIWESIRNVNNKDNPQQWQFRYEPLFLPEVNTTTGKLAITKVKFGTKVRLSFNVILNNQKAKTLAFDEIKRAYPTNASQISSSQISAIVLSSLSINIPDIKDVAGVRLVNPDYPAVAANQSFLVVIEVSDDKTAEEVKELLESNTVAIFYTQAFAAKQAIYNSVKVKFADLKKTNLFTKLNGLNTTSVYVHREDMRRLLEKSSSFISVEGQIENPEQFDRDLITAALDRL